MEKFVATALTAFVSFLFLIGYLYLYGYYNYYNIGMHELNLTLQDIVVHSFISIRFSLNSSWLLLVAILAIVTVSAYLKFGKALDGKFLSQLIVLPITLCLLFFSFQAVNMGSQSASIDFSRNPIIVSGDSAVSHIRDLFQDHEIWLRHLRTNGTVSHYLVQMHSGGSDKWVVRVTEKSVRSVVYLDR